MEFADYQASHGLRLDDGTVLTACERCRMDLEGKQPPCDTCRVDLMPENLEAATVYFDCRNQKIFEMKIADNGMPYSQLIDINITAVKDSMWIHRVKDREDCLSKVRRCFYHFEGERE